MKYVMSDGSAYEEIEADSLADAKRKAREWIREVELAPTDPPRWEQVYVARYDEAGEVVEDATVRVRIDPPEPPCSGGEHDWKSPLAIVGGLKENPGVWGHGGGVVIREVCARCGWYRVEDTWYQDDYGRPTTAVWYEEPDEVSERWVYAHRRKEEADQDV